MLNSGLEGAQTCTWASSYLDSPLKSKHATRVWIDSLHSNMFAVQSRRTTLAAYSRRPRLLHPTPPTPSGCPPAGPGPPDLSPKAAPRAARRTDPASKRGGKKKSGQATNQPCENTRV